MKKLRSYRILLTICVCFFYTLQAQSYTDIAGTINSFSKVTSVSGTDVLVDNQVFAAGDVVLLIQMKGAAFRANGTDATWGSRTFYRDAGHYEFLVVDEVIGNLVRFTRNVIRTYVVSDFVQLIKVPVYENARIAGTLITNPWNGNTGGILAFVVKDELLFDADIDVKHAGFRGGETVPLDVNVCNIGTNDYTFSTSFFKAGNKGEGLGLYWTLPPDENINPVNNDFARGRGSIINAGGGGNGRYAGGGGGANFGKGGTGGYPDEICGAIYNSYQSTLSFAIGDFFLDGFKGKRLVLGGGGGSGTSGFDRTGGKGGNSGGMVIIIAGKVNGNGKKIIANGQDGGNATGGAGGGGAGGTVALHVNEYINSLDIEIKGGKGGNGNTTSGERTGPGGGGSGGTLLIKQTALPSSINLHVDRGVAGTPSLFGAFPGEEGGVFPDLKLTLNGFLFFSITDDQLVCQNVFPDELIGTLPIGGSGVYTYQWETSNNGITWANAPDASTEINYQPPAPGLPGTIFYRRVTSDTSPFPDQIVDPGLPVEIEVLPAITDNDIYLPLPYFGARNICEGALPGNFTGSESGGGDGLPPDYQWWKNENEAGWVEISGATGQSFISGVLTDSTKFYRTVISSVCRDTSNILTINVHPLIQNNTIGDPQTICTSQTPDPLTGSNSPVLLGGIGSYTFLWQVNTGTWQPATGGNSGQNYTFPAELTASAQYRRRVVSGECTDFSLPLTITVLPAISGNTIGTDTTLCTGQPPTVPLGGGNLGGGNTNYDILWEKSTDNVGYTSTGSTSLTYNPGGLQEQTYFHRVVTSGPCLDISNVITVNVDPRPVFATVSPNDTLYFNFNTILEADIPVRGTGSWSVQKGSAILSSPNNDVTDVSNLSRGENEFIYRIDHLNCFIDTLVNVFVRDIFRPNAFSPNGDVINDYLTFYGLENSESNEVTIINRQGNVVFRAKNYQIGTDAALWDGLDQSGNPVGDDTYYYVLVVNNRFKYQGYILLKR